MTDDLTIKEAAFRARAQLEEGDAEVLLHAGHARALVEEIERLRGHLDPEACLVRAGKPPGTQTGFEFVVSSPIVRVIANHMAATLKAHGAQNYVEIGFTHEELGPLTLMVQRDRGDTPARKVAERDAEIERLRTENAQLHQEVANRLTAAEVKELLGATLDAPRRASV